jgi:hypothetical protein
VTRDLKPTRLDLQRLVELYGSIEHLGTAVGVRSDELRAWLSGKREIPVEHYSAIMALVTKSTKK